MHPFQPFAGDRLQIGRVLAGTLGVLRRGWLVILPLAILLEWAPAGGQDYVMTLLAARMEHAPYLGPAIGFVAWLVFPLADMAVVVASLGILRGRPVSFGAALIAAIGLYPAAFVLDFIQNLVALAQPLVLPGTPKLWVGVGAEVVSLVYGLATAALLLPSMAVAGEERLGARAALVRSAALTRGDRLRVVIFAAQLMFLQMFIAPVSQAFVLEFAGRGLVATWLSFLPGVLIFAFASTSQATLYWELARLRDGAAPADVDAVFG